MRDIKFRGKRVDNGEWVYGYYVDYYTKSKLDGKHIVHGGDGGNQLYDTNCEVIPETVGEFTGLHDRNGKEIYEGDIVKKVDTIGLIVFNNTYEQYVSHRCCGFLINWIKGERKDTYRIDLPFWALLGNVEVIGNIHDNPELIEEKQIAEEN